MPSFTGVAHPGLRPPTQAPSLAFQYRSRVHRRTPCVFVRSFACSRYRTCRLRYTSIERTNSHMAIDPSKLFPSILPKTSLAEFEPGSTISLDMGEGMIAVLVEDSDDEAVDSVSPAAVREQDLPLDDLWDRAFQNLGELFGSGVIPVQVGALQTGEKTVIVGPHWLASSMLASPGLQEYFARLLEAPELQVYLPGQEYVVFTPFPCSFATSNEAVKIVAHLKEELEKTWDDLSFVYTQDGLRRPGPAAPTVLLKP